MLGAAPCGAEPNTSLARAPQAEPSSAQRAEARSRFHRGLELYDEGDLDAALVELMRAYELSPSYKLLFNIAQIRRQKADYVGALDAFERYLAEGDRRIPGARREKVESEIQKLKARIAQITITGSAGAELSVDDVPRGTLPLSEPVRVNAGRRKLTLSQPGRAPINRYVDVAGAERIAVELVLPEALSAEPERAPSVLLPEPKRAAPTRAVTPERRPVKKAPPAKAPPGGVPWLPWATTAALGAGALVTGALALDASRDLEQSRNTLGADPDALDRTSRKTKNLALAADILAGAAVLAGGVSLYVTLSSGSREYSGETARVPLRFGAAGRF